MSTIGRGRFPFRSAWLFRPSRRSRSSSLERILKDTRFSHLDHNDDLVKRNFFFDAAPTIRERWVDTASSSGGNGTTSATTGANRAYASLSDAITAESATGTLADLVSANEYLVIHCNGSSADTTAVDIPSTVKTSSTCYVKIVVDQANRHDGKWNSGKYRLVTNGYFGSLVVRCDHFIGEGLQVENNATSVPDGSRHGISCRSTGSSGLFSIHECVVRYTGDYTNQDPHGISDNGRSSTNVITQIVNNVVYDFNKNLYMGSQSGDSYTLYHNTSVDPVVEGMTILRYGSGASFYVKNNIIQGANTNYYSESATATLSSAGNITEDTTSPDSGGRSIAITFVNEAGNDFHTNDGNALSSTNLYADSRYPVTIDIDGAARPSSSNVFAGSDEGVVAANVGSAAGTSSVSGVGASVIPGVGSSTGVSTPTAVGGSTFNGVGSATGVGAATGVGVALAPGVGSSSGVGSASGASNSIAASPGLSTGAGVATGAGASDDRSTGSSSGVATPTGVGASTAQSVGASSGVGTATGVGTGLGPMAGSSSGASTVSGVASSVASSAGSSAGVGAAASVGKSDAASAGASSGTGAATGVGKSTSASPGASAGVGAATGVGSSLALSPGSSAGTTTCSGVGAFSSTSGSTGASTGVGAAAGVGKSDAKSPGSSTGLSAVTGFGAAVSSVSAGSSGTSSVSAVGSSVVSSQGQSTGVNTSSGVGSSQVRSVGSVVGQSAVLGVSLSTVAVVGLSSGNSTASGSGVSEFPGQASAQGSSITSATLSADSVAVGSIVGVSTAQASSVLFTTAVAFAAGGSVASARGSFVPKAPQQTQSSDSQIAAVLAPPMATVVKVQLGNLVQRK